MQTSSQIITNNIPKPSFLQTCCLSCHPTNTLRAVQEKYHILWICSSLVCGDTMSEALHVSTISIILAPIKSRKMAFWSLLTQVVLENGR